MILVIGDMHLKNKEPYFTAQKEFLNWVDEKYPKHELLFLGDVFDTSSPAWNVFETFKSFISNRKGNVHILEGNHDKSAQKGSAVQNLQIGIDNVYVYTERQEIVIDGKKCLVCPYTYDKSIYEDFSWNGDYCFLHLTNKEDAFGDEWVNTEGIKATQIFGHTHTFREVNKNKIVLGVPVPTRNLEINNNIIEITDSGYSYIKHPEYFNFEDIKYGDFPDNKNNILNIKDAPSIMSVYDMYKDYYVRYEGITFITDEEKDDSDVFDFNSDNLEISWKDYTNIKEHNVSNDVNNTALKYFAIVR